MDTSKRAKVVYFVQPRMYQAEYGGLTIDLRYAELYDIELSDGEILENFGNWQPDVAIRTVKITVELE